MIFFSSPPPLQVVQGEAEVVTIEMIVGIGIPQEGVILAVLGTGIMDHLSPMAQIRTEAMGATAAAAMASMEEATMVMDSQTLVTTRMGHLEVRTTSRANSLVLVRLLRRTAWVIPRSPSPRDRLLRRCHSNSSILHRHWCRTPCLLSSHNKLAVHLKEVIYCFFFLSELYT